MSDLAPLEGPARRHPFIVGDVESKDGASQKAGFTRPFLVGLYDGVTYTPFTDSSRSGSWRERYFWEGGCVDRFMRCVLQKRYRGHHVYAHNAGRFDYLFFLPWLMHSGEKLGFRFSVIPVASSIQVLDVWRVSDRLQTMAEEALAEGDHAAAKRYVGKRWRRWRFLDSYKLIPTSLDKAAKGFGLEGKLSHDLDLPEWDPSWPRYNKQDCVELFGVLGKFHHYIEDVLLGEVGITAPATSVKLFRRRFLKKSIPRSVETHGFVRSGYFGGRVEVFRRSGENLRYYDINSSYPRAMLDEMPIGEGVFWEGEPPARFRDRRIGFVEADVLVPEMEIPPLPVRAKKSDGLPEGKLVFPVGRLHGIWEWSELSLALELGCSIEKFHKSVWYESGPLFEDFVRTLYRYRDKSQSDYDPGLAEVVKIMLNSAYGKFGMRTLRKKVYRFDDPDLPENAVPASSDPESPIWYAEEEVDAPYIIPQIAARVTAVARVQLYRQIFIPTAAAGGKLFYTDTDAGVVDVVLPTGPKLGELKDEFPEYSGKLKGEFVGPKLYLLSAPGTDFTKVKAKGIERRKTGKDGRKLTPKEIDAEFEKRVRKLAAGETLYQKRLEKVGTLARAGFLRGPREILVPRRLLPDQGKRIMLPGGGTRAYSVDMWKGKDK